MTATLFLTSGAFGTAVAERFCRLQAAKVAPLPQSPDDLTGLLLAAGSVVVAAWRPYSRHFARIDDLCFALGIRWSVAEIHGQRLTAGPLVIPGSGPCYHCYRKRWNVHHPAPERELVLDDAYRRDPELGPPGFIAPLVSIAAAALHEDAEAPAEQAGRIRLVDVLTGSVLTSTVIGVHGCLRCRPQPAARPGARFVDHLVPVIKGMLP